MADDQSQQEKTEDATPQRREEFRKQGQVAQSKELGSAMVLIAMALVFWMLSRHFLSLVFETYSTLYEVKILEVVKSHNIMPAMKFAFQQMALFIFPVGIILFFVGLLSTVFQIGILITEEPLKMNLNKINPLEGLKRVLSLRSVMEGLKAIAKLTLVSLVIYFSLRSDALILPKLIYSGPMDLLVFIGGLLFKTMIIIGMVMLVLALADYLYQRFELENKMKMTKQEIKDESKQREGDPLIKARIRRVQKEMATRRMMADVPKADVIITNPTHIAIAIKYQPEKFAAPLMVAKGTGEVAKKIREIAKEYKIPIVENKPLARTIFKTLEIGQMIPRELFTAVAEVLAYVFKLKRRSRVYG